jgi:hypothetical protein
MKPSCSAWSRSVLNHVQYDVMHHVPPTLMYQATIPVAPTADRPTLLLKSGSNILLGRIQSMRQYATIRSWFVVDRCNIDDVIPSSCSGQRDMILMGIAFKFEAW